MPLHDEFKQVWPKAVASWFSWLQRVAESSIGSMSVTTSQEGHQHRCDLLMGYLLDSYNT